MLRYRLFVLFVVVALTLVWVVPVAAADPDPDTCLSKPDPKDSNKTIANCYVSNVVLSGTNSGTAQDGTAQAPWVISDSEARANFRIYTFTPAAYGTGVKKTLTVIVCGSNGCAYTVFSYENNKEELGDPQPGIPPEIGVSLPFPYLLGGGVLLGAVLVSTGVVLRRRARRSTV